MINLAQAFPLWRFTAVEPAIAMLDVCRQRVEECGITSRCTFHEGYLDSLPESDSFEAATCLVVSHFLLQKEERRNFFNQIALRLRPQGYLISSDIAYDMSTSAYQSLLEVWLRMMKSAELPEDDIEKMRAAYGRDVAVLPPKKSHQLLHRLALIHLCYFFRIYLFMLGIHDEHHRIKSPQRLLATLKRQLSQIL